MNQKKKINKKTIKNKMKLSEYKRILKRTK